MVALFAARGRNKAHSLLCIIAIGRLRFRLDPIEKTIALCLNLLHLHFHRINRTWDVREEKKVCKVELLYLVYLCKSDSIFKMYDNVLSIPSAAAEAVDGGFVMCLARARAVPTNSSVCVCYRFHCFTKHSCYFLGILVASLVVVASLFAAFMYHQQKRDLPKKQNSTFNIRTMYIYLSFFFSLYINVMHDVLYFSTRIHEQKPSFVIFHQTIFACSALHTVYAVSLYVCVCARECGTKT